MLSEVLLTNFKAFTRTALPLRPVTLLSGTNGSGKSSVLQALAVLRQSHDADALSDGLLLNGPLVDLGSGQDVLNDAREDDAMEAVYGVPTVGISITDDGQTYEWASRYESDSDMLKHLTPPPDVSRCTLLTGHFQYVRADRLSPSTVYGRSHRQVERQRFLGARGEYTADFLIHHGDEAVSASLTVGREESPSHTMAAAVNTWLQLLCPGIDLQYNAVAGTDFARLNYGLGGTAGIDASNRYRPTNVGFGLSYVLPIIVACISGGPDSTILMENPEAHLHPRGQSAMGELIGRAAQTGAQIIVESHSDHLLNGLRLAVKNETIASHDLCMYHFSRSGRQLKIHNPKVGADGMIDEWPPGFFDEWGANLERLLD